MSHPSRVILMRHSETPWSTIGRYAGHTDLPLSEAGIQAATVRRATMPSLEAVTKLFSSPLQRAYHTAELIAPGHQITTDPRLLERDYGDYEGLTTSQIRERHPGWNIWHDPIPHGETLDAFTQRVDSFLEHLTRSDDTTIFVVAHAHWIRLATARWLRLGPEQAALFRLDTLGVSVLGWERETPVLLGWGAP